MSIEPSKQKQPFRLGEWLERHAGTVFILPSVIVVLLLSIFPLIISAYLSLSRLKFVQGGLEVSFVGFKNYRKLLLGSERRHFLGSRQDLSMLQWGIFAIFILLLLVLLWRYWRSNSGKTQMLLPYFLGYGVISYLFYNVFFNWPVATTLHSMVNGIGIPIEKTLVRLIMFGIFVIIFIFTYGRLRVQSSHGAGLVYRLITFTLMALLFHLVLRNVAPEARPGTVVTTLFYVFAGITIQYLLGLGLALLTTQKLPGRRFFRVVFLLPMMITPVGVAYVFRMMTDTSKGPFEPIWKLLGLVDYSWVNEPWGARSMVLIGDVWQWTPFMFIILLAAVEGLPEELFEAAHVDGASGWQIFRNITMPQLIPVSVTVILIRMIEAFKIIDLPNIMTFGGPGTATESLTLHSFFAWRTLDVGASAAVAYMLMILALFVCMSYTNLIHQKVAR